MSTSVQQAREALGTRLSEIRKDANLTGRALAALCGWHFTKVSKIEHGTQNASEDDLRAWCQHCRAESKLPDLIATVRTIESMYVEWRRTMRAGLKNSQVSSVPLYERTHTFRVYEMLVLPGLLHTAEYAAAIFNYWVGFLDIPDDVNEAVAARMERQRVLYNGDRRFMFVIEEQALHTHVGDAEIMAGQLDRLLAITSLPRVSLGIIPRGGERRTFAQGSFWLFDDLRVQLEGISAGIEITQPGEIVLYSRMFALLQESAVYGADARALIGGALSRLQGT
ncbi:helix-turn-helix domain-containing protein [Streptosporangium subroseum]|uniref:helix-turn-helix domain-containing protein n=1 Tax=Streptosporangium subroseum TaxID=106412 RepID=UPI003092DC5C|nr:helix-turn-helix transcriptional regulator [Streptosporangium subroseum]